MDITYIPMARGFVYLCAVVDWFSRRVLAWRLSITMEVEFCLEAVEEALVRHGKPEIFNTDQGSQFTSADFTGLLLKHAIAISMDGKGSWRDNVFVERLWRSVKYEEVYLRAYDSVAEARASIGRYLDFYNRKRPHSCLDARTPEQGLFRPAAAGRGSMISPPCSGRHSGRATPSRRASRNRHSRMATGRASTYQERKAVQTNPATSSLPLRSQGKTDARNADHRPPGEAVHGAASGGCHAGGCGGEGGVQ